MQHDNQRHIVNLAVQGARTNDHWNDLPLNWSLPEPQAVRSLIAKRPNWPRGAKLGLLSQPGTQGLRGGGPTTEKGSSGGGFHLQEVG